MKIIWEKVIGTIIALIILAVVSWGLFIGIIYLICHLMNWHFSLAAATAVWLIAYLLRISLSGKK